MVESITLISKQEEEKFKILDSFYKEEKNLLHIFYIIHK